MTDETTKILLSQVRERKEIPTLTLETAVSGFVQVEFGDEINAIEDTQEREKRRKDITDYYLNGNGKEVVEGVIETMEYYYYLASTIITQVSETAALMSPMNLVPSTLVTGSAAGAANPAWVSPHNKFLKGSLTTQLLMGKDALGELFNSAILLHFNIASVAAVSALVATATAAEAVIKSIV